MQKELILILTPAQANDWHEVKKVAAYSLRVDVKDVSYIQPLKRSVDARKYPAKIRLKALVYFNESAPEKLEISREYPNISGKEEVLIIGCGPAGMFAALKLIELGKKPIIIERGKDVKSRRRDLAAINKQHIVNPDSNYCFGEGGAGTYSDGKLYTRASKRGSIESILETLVAHGAKEDILYEAHPHIGTNKLPKVVQSMRESILNAGGEIHFNTRIEDLIINQNKVSGVITQNGDKIEAKNVILATGHSARDIYELLHKKSVLIESKPFAIGVRVEHSQDLIDSAQYKCNNRGPYLPPASYSLVKQV
ncbi:MAG: FAD-dependent oxidoreductase, partial [Flavobacteriales bacterium]|nr:FAD-dependent oxidoreductase [Flavobacteriales bacterium]